MLLSPRLKFAAVAVSILGGIVASSVALAQDRSAQPPARATEAQSPERGPQGGPGRALVPKIARNTMRVSREIFYEGRTVVVKTDRGELVSVGDATLTVKYLDGTTADVETVGEVKVCASGKPDAGLGDLQAGKPVGIHRATNLPGGDMTVVIQVSSRKELNACKEMAKGIKEKLGITEAP